MALNRGYPVRHFRDLRLDMLDHDTIWAKRLRHVVRENARVQQAVEVLESDKQKSWVPYSVNVIAASVTTMRSVVPNWTEWSNWAKRTQVDWVVG